MPPDIREDRPDCPRELVDICVKMIQKNADARYQSCSEVAAVLEAWLASKNEVTATVETRTNEARERSVAVGHVNEQRPNSNPSFPGFKTTAVVGKSPQSTTARASDSPSTGKPGPFDPALEDTASDKARGTIIGRASADDFDDALEVQIIEDNAPSTPYDDSGTINLGIEAERSVASRVRGRSSRSSKTASRATKKAPMPAWAWGAIAAGVVIVLIVIAVLATSDNSTQPPPQKGPQQAPRQSTA